jgi:asparagine synthase (glutamine-hydrolysing)
VSALAGCCWFDDRPARAGDLGAALAAARHRAREPFRVRCAGPVVLAYAGDDPNACQPFHDASSRTTLLVDGRVDNVEDLADALGADRSVEAVVLAAWRRWGLDCGAHLLGDFVVVVSCETTRRVVCVRDPMGQRPLFFSRSPCAVVFGSEVQQVVRQLAAETGARPALNEAMIAEYLTGEPESIDETLWSGVYRLPPAHTLEVAGDRATVRRYWDFDPEARVEYARAGEYAEHFREIFTRAVKCRVRDADRVGVFLSGGIDSSSVAGMAQTIQAAAGRESIHAFTVSFPGRPCDETAYSQAVVAKWGLPAAGVEAEPPTRAALELAAARDLDIPASPSSLVADPLRARAASAGARVVLTGYGGDDFYTGDPSSPLDLLRAGRVVAWGRAIVSPVLSDRTRRRLRPVLGARPVRRPWIRPELASRVALADRLRPRAVLSFPTREQQQTHRAATSLVRILGDELEHRSAQASGIDQRHPFYDRRVAEYGLALPVAERSSGREIKVVVRRALADCLPPLVASRTSLADKAEFSSTYVEAIEALGGRRAFDRLRTEDSGWVDRPAIRRMYDDMIRLYSHGSDAYIALSEPLWAVIALETWLDACEKSTYDRPCELADPTAGEFR